MLVSEAEKKAEISKSTASKISSTLIGVSFKRAENQ
jgi:hypothetical protein